MPHFKQSIYNLMALSSKWVRRLINLIDRSGFLMSLYERYAQGCNKVAYHILGPEEIPNQTKLVLRLASDFSLQHADGKKQDFFVLLESFRIIITTIAASSNYLEINNIFFTSRKSLLA